MKTHFCKRSMAMLLSIVMVFSMIAGLTINASAAGVEEEVCAVSFPRGDDVNLDYSGTWGTPRLQFMNGWHHSKATYTTIFAVGSFSGNACYCIEPGTPLNNGDKLSQMGEEFFDKYPSTYNKTIDADTIKTFIGRIFQYGYTGKVSTSWRSQNEGAEYISWATATQLLIWETVVGERDEDFNHVTPPAGYNKVLDRIQPEHPLRAKILSYYNTIESGVKAHAKLPSFCSKTTGKATTIEMTWDGSKYTAVLTDTNNVLGNYNFTCSDASVKCSVNGNKLTLSSSVAPSQAVSITAEKKNSLRKGIVVWQDGVYKPGVGLQDLVTYAQDVNDPVKGFVKAKVSYGSAKIVKVSEDDKVEGLSFTVTGTNYSKTFTTDKSGSFTADNLAPGVYTVTETTYDKYNPQAAKRVTVVAGQTATVTFSNTLRRGDLSVIKTCEDNLNAGIKFHLFGTSLSGIAVNEYAITDKNGVATFKDVLIGSNYTLEEVETAERYVVPDNQKAAVEWNKVTEKNFDNHLKKFNVTVTKSDAETGTAQGDGTLAGAVYGIYKGGQLVDKYTTDVNGQFTTSYYTCGDDWTIREISASEGYLVNDTIYPVGAQAKKYTVEYNTAPVVDADEEAIKGKITIIKHCDDGSTQIESPEVGAEFAVYIKSAGSYDKAKDSERDYLVCDENGFAETKLLPYGRYTVLQTKGEEGKELMKPFDVFVKKNGETYRYLINNAPFKSYVKVVKTDAETGKTIPYEGAAFQIFRPDGSKVEMTFTYPQVTTIDTFYTTSEGMLVTPQVLDYGNGYSLVEVGAPYGYVLNSDPVYFDVTEENATIEDAVTVVKVERPNMAQKGTITATKTGEVFSSVTEASGIYQPVFEDRGLSGAVFSVIAAEDIITPDGTLRCAKDSIVATITTDESGKAITAPLYLGKYTIREDKAPYGMVLNLETKDVELAYEGQNIEVTATATSFYNERQHVRISLEKIMEKDERFGIGNNGELSAVSFGLYAAEDMVAADGKVIPKDALIEIVSCNESGEASFNTDLPAGAKTYVKEISTDSHYVLADQKYPVIFEYAGQDVATVDISVNDGKPIDNEIIYGTVRGYKVDRETEEAIAGAVFGLFFADETELIEDNAILITESDENGIFVFENVPYGNYIIRELKPAEGYLDNETDYPVTVAEKDETVEIKAVNDRIPEIGTTAAVDGEKEICATEVFTLSDVVKYKHLVPGKEYTVKGILMDKSTGKAFTENGEPVVSEVEFIPENASGSVTVEFEFDGRLIKTETEIVVFESLYADGKELTVHADIEDEGQTVIVHVPEIKTTATTDGKKEVTTAGTVTVEDIVSYKNLTIGKEYVVNGILMNKATGEAFTVNGKPITAETTFTAESKDGEVKVVFTFDASGITKSTSLVVFETIYREGVEIAAHADIEDEGQTVTITPPAPEVPQTGDDSNLGFWIGLGAIAIGGLIACAIIFIKSKKDDDDE